MQSPARVMERAGVSIFDRNAHWLSLAVSDQSVPCDYSRKVRFFPRISPPVESWVVFAPLPSHAE